MDFGGQAVISNHLFHNWNWIYYYYFLGYDQWENHECRKWIWSSSTTGSFIQPKRKKEKRTGSFKLFDNWHSGPRKFKGDFFFFFLQERKPYPFYFYIRVYVQQVFCFLLLFFILFYFMEVGLFVRFTLKCHNNRTRRNFRFTYCLYATYCRK